MEQVRIHYIESGGRGLYRLQKKKGKDWIKYTNIGRMMTPLQLKKFKAEASSKWEIMLSPSAREAIFNQNKFKQRI